MVVDSRGEDDLSGEDFGFSGADSEAINFDELSERINSRIQSKMGNMERRAREAEQRAAERAQIASERAEEKLRRAMKKINFNFDIPTEVHYPAAAAVPQPPQPPQPVRPASKASDEERLMILNMLKDGRISAAEASRLLDVLDGKIS